MSGLGSYRGLRPGTHRLLMSSRDDTQQPTIMPGEHCQDRPDEAIRSLGSLAEPVVPAPPPSRSPRVLERRYPVFYTAAETSKILRLDESTLYRHLRNGTFPGVKIGGRYVIPHAALERLISDVLATGRCLDLAEWTERWCAEQHAAVRQLGVVT